MRRAPRPPWTRLVALAFVFAFATRTRAEPAPARLVVHAARVFDGERVLSAAWVTIELGVVRRIDATAPPAGTGEVVELGDATLLPGLIDVHVHLLLAPGRDIDRGRVTMLRESSAAKAMRGLRAAQDLLQAGFTTIRVPGDFDLYRAHLDVRDAIDDGRLVGPRIVGADRFITRTGGHYDATWVAPEQSVEGWARIADGPEQIVEAVRAEVRAGADWVKLAASGGVTTPRSLPKVATFTDEEMGAAVTEAHRLKRKVAVHAHAAEAIDSAIRAGVDSIEHGSAASDGQLREMAARRIYWVPTWHQRMEGDDRARWLAEWRADSDHGPYCHQLKTALEAHTPLAFGTDSGLYPHGENARMLTLLVECGMPPLDALRTITSRSAKMLDLPVGRIAVGAPADLVAVRGDAVKDVSLLEHVGFVMRAGAIVRRDF